MDNKKKMSLVLLDSKEIIGSLTYINFETDEKSYQSYMQGNTDTIGSILFSLLQHDFNDFSSFIHFVRVFGVSGFVSFSKTAESNINTSIKNESQQRKFLESIWNESKSTLIKIQNEYREAIEFCFFYEKNNIIQNLSPLQRYHILKETSFNKLDAYAEELIVGYDTSINDSADYTLFIKTRREYKEYVQVRHSIEELTKSNRKKSKRDNSYKETFNKLATKNNEYIARFNDDFNKLSIEERAYLIQGQQINFESYYSSYNIGSLCYVEFMEILKRGLIIKKCAIRKCGMYFIPEGRSDTLYCDSCRNGGAHNAYKQKLLENDYLKLYNKEYQRRYQKIRNYPKSIRETKLKEIRSWVKKAKLKMDEPGLTPEQFEQWIDEEKESEKNGR